MRRRGSVVPEVADRVELVLAAMEQAGRCFRCSLIIGRENVDVEESAFGFRCYWPVGWCRTSPAIDPG
jgi:hypothetical protein